MTIAGVSVTSDVQSAGPVTDMPSDRICTVLGAGFLAMLPCVLDHASRPHGAIHLTTTFVLHDPTAPPGLAAGAQGMKDFQAPYFAAFPDVQFTVEDQIAEGDQVVARWTARGTHRGTLMGIAPTGKHVTVTGIAIWRVEQGKMAEMWQNWDALGLLQQVGAIPQIAQAGA
jgi:steroid delta-isomerase-like uncharacterized protein